jgi:protein CpxP
LLDGAACRIRRGETTRYKADNADISLIQALGIMHTCAWHNPKPLKGIIMKHLRATLVSGLMAAGLASAVYAAPAMPAAAAPDHGGMHGMEHGGERRAEAMARRQAVLHDKLKLTGTQEAAWKTYVEAIKPPQAGSRPDRPQRADWEKLSAPERMEKMLAMMKEREARMTTHVAAMKTFYATLSPLQQQIFNDNVAGPMHARHGGRSPG